MENKQLFLIVLLAGFNISVYAQKHFKPQYATVLDTSKGGKLLKQCSRSSPDSVSGFWAITSNDVNLLEDNFKKIFALKGENCCTVGPKIKTLKGYCYQFIGVIIKGEKYIYINAFSFEADDLSTYLKGWKTDPIIMCDGGTGEWGALFNIKQQSFGQLSFNGVG